jgi:hypothetical protein
MEMAVAHKRLVSNWDLGINLYPSSQDATVDMGSNLGCRPY